jgi:hypothetical protein
LVDCRPKRGPASASGAARHTSRSHEGNKPCDYLLT